MLRLEDIHAGYGRVEVLRGVNLVVPTGAAVALLGANGAGKTTLLKVAAGLVRHSAGTIVLDGERIDHQPTQVRARKGLCLVPEGRGIFRDLSVRENLAMFAGRRTLGDVVERTLEAFPVLRSRLDHLAGRLSGGQQQMVAFARALTSDAKIILADELSVGLAPVIVDEIFATVAQLRTEGRSLLIVEQYVDRALEVVDDIYILHKGRVVFVGDPDLCRDRGVFDTYIGAQAHS